MTTTKAVMNVMVIVGRIELFFFFYNHNREETNLPKHRYILCIQPYVNLCFVEKKKKKKAEKK